MTGCASWFRRGKHRGEYRRALVCLDGSQPMGEVRGAMSGEERVRVSPPDFQTEASVVGPVERTGGGAFSWLFVLPPRSGATFAGP